MKKIKQVVDEQYFEDLAEPLADLMAEISNDTVSVIAERVKKIGELSPSDAQRIVSLARIEDMEKIKENLARITGESPELIEEIFEKASQRNDELASVLYDASGKKQIASNVFLSSIKARALKSSTEGILNFSKTTAFKIDGKVTSIQKAYNDAINKAVLEVTTGVTDYTTAMRSSIEKLADSGVRVVEYESGHTRRLDSAVRQNVLDGVRSFNQEYRKRQAEEYGGNKIFVSLHGLCAEDHQHINGQDYTLKQWEEVSGALQRQVGTNNCRHAITYGIDGISINPYTDEDRKQALNMSNEKVTFKTASGREITKTKVEADQYMRQLETKVRDLKYKQLKFEKSGDTVASKLCEKQIKQQSKDYKRVAKEVGLRPKMDRMRIVE